LERQARGGVGEALAAAIRQVAREAGPVTEAEFDIIEGKAGLSHRWLTFSATY